MSRPNVFYFRTDHPSVPDIGFVAPALKSLLGVPQDELKALANEIATYPGFLSRTLLKEMISKRLEKDELTLQLTFLFQWAHAFFRSTSKDPQEIYNRVAKWSEGEENQDPKVLTPEDLEKLKDLIPLLLQPTQAQNRQSKAEMLANATGLTADSIDLICDIRPVFDDDRDQIEGLIPVTTLRVVASGVDRFPISVEVLLSAKDVQELLKKTELAVKKLNVLGRFAEANKLPIPAVDLTETLD